MIRKILLFLLATAYCCGQISAQTLDKKIASTNGPVHVTLQSGDTVYIGGSFSQLGTNVRGLARFKPGSAKPDSAFPFLGNNCYVYAMESDGNGGFYLGGYFDMYNGNSITPTAIIHVLNNGVLDKDFATVDDEHTVSISALRKKGNRLFVGGNFYALQGVQRPFLAALNATTGAIDNWKPDPPDSRVNGIETSDSLVFIRGDFSYVGTTYLPNKFAALKSKNGKLFTDFPTSDAYITSFKTDGNTLYLGGNFNYLGYKKQGIAKVDPVNADVNTAFPSTDGSIFCILPDGNGGYYLGGSFTRVNNSERNSLVHILADGNVDASFYASVDGIVYNLASDGTSLYVCGKFTRINGITRNNVGSVTLSEGTITAFNPDANNNVYTIAINKGVVYMGGIFTTLQGKNRNFAGAITIANNITSWAPDANGAVNKIILNNNGTSIFLGGEFTRLKEKVYSFLAKVNTTNGNAYAWTPKPDNSIFSMILNGNLLYVKGLFSNINGVNRHYLAAIDTSANKPTSFKADIDGNNFYSQEFNALSIAGGKLYVGGEFSNIKDSLRTNIARINLATGLVDQWNSGNTINPNNLVYAVHADANGVFLGGGFDFLGRANRNRLAAIDLGNGNKIKSWKAEIPYFLGSGVSDILHYGKTIFACGDFYYDTATTSSASGIYMYNLIALNDSTGKITQQFSQYPNGPLLRMCIYDKKLMVTGGFIEFKKISDGSIAASNKFLAGYNLSNYQLAPEAYNPNEQVRMVTDKSGNLITSGNFYLINFVYRNRLASIDLNTGQPTSWDPNPNYEIYALAIKDTTLFVGGNFQHIGTNQLSRKNLAAISIKTGEALSKWSADANEVVYDLAVKDSILYVGGSFTNIRNVSRNFAAALNVKNGMVNKWDPNPSSGVNSILPLNDYVYIGGNFLKVKGKSYPYLAKVNNTNGEPVLWTPNPSNPVNSIVNSGRNIFVGGNFVTIASQPRNALAAFDSVSNTLTGFDAKIRNPGIIPMAIYGRNIYIGGSFLFQGIGDSARGLLAGIDTVSRAPLAFNPQPDNYFDNRGSNSLSVGKNKLFAGGTWKSLKTQYSPSFFAVFTLEPQNNTSNLSFANLQPTSVTAKFKPGDGENRLVIIRQGGKPVNPIDGKNYIANASYALGDTTSLKSYVVYNGKRQSVSISNLQPGKSYTVSVYEYNGTGSACDYLTYTPLTKSFTTPTGLMKPADSTNAEQIITTQITDDKLYPNPAKNKCTIEFKAENNQKYIIELADATGKILLRDVVNAVNGSNSLDLKIGNLVAGIYYVNIIDENGERKALKLIKQ